MNVLIIGSGGREHAFANSLRKSEKCGKLFVAPGNAGTEIIAENLPISVEDFDKIAETILLKEIEMLIIGPEVPLVNGLVDYLNSRNELNSLKIIGPNKQGARLEGSKEFSKKFMENYNIPTGKSRTFTKSNIDEGIAYLSNKSGPFVLKADGLAAGKGVIITDNETEAIQILKEMLIDEKFGSASARVLVEDFLEGIEVSIFVLTDGEDYIILPEAKDYKRIGEGDTGLNTGGMGAVSPVKFVDNEFLNKVDSRIVKPTIEGLKTDGIDYKGFIFIGLMNNNGEPYVIEYNVRMGDPETEAVLPRINSDFLELMDATAEKRLKDFKLEISNKTAVTTVLVAEGYPGSYRKGDAITNLDNEKDVFVFQAGTISKNDEIITNGGRVLAVTALGENLNESIGLSQKKAENIKFKGKYFRRDIGQDLLKY